MDSLVLVVDPNGRVTHANELAVTRLGSVVGTTLEGLTTPEVARLIMNPESANGWKGAVLFKGLNEVTLNGMVSTLSLREDGALRSVVLVVRDAELENAERETLLRELLAGTSHGLNNPLAIVTGYTELFLEDPSLEESQKEKLEAIHRNALRASAILQALRTFVNRRRSQRTSTQLNSVVEVVLQLKVYDLQTCGIEVATQFDEKLQPVLADSGQLQQALLNILNNAQEALTLVSARRLTVETLTTGRYAAIRIADSGPGISEENLGSVFEPFFSTKPGGKGRGLGLFMANRIIEEHGGRIQIESEVGNGTQVTILLPLPS